MSAFDQSGPDWLSHADLAGELLSWGVVPSTAAADSMLSSVGLGGAVEVTEQRFVETFLDPAAAKGAGGLRSVAVVMQGAKDVDEFPAITPLEGGRLKAFLDGGEISPKALAFSALTVRVRQALSREISPPYRVIIRDAGSGWAWMHWVCKCSISGLLLLTHA